MSRKSKTNVLLQRAVSEIEESVSSFEGLCEALASSEYGTKRKLDATGARDLLVKSNVVIAFDKPSQPSADTDEEKEITVFDEGGRGRKQCPSCKKFVGVRNAICACGNDFNVNPSVSKKSADEDKDIPTYDEGGRGRKECPSCKKFIGVRNLVCICGHEFKKKETPVPKPVVERKKETILPAATKRATPVELNGMLTYPGRGYARTWVAAGDPPHRLSGVTSEEVKDWMNKCRKTMMENREWLTANALIHWLRMGRYFPNGDQEEFESVRQIIMSASAPEDVDDP